MKITITARHFEASDSLKDHIEDNLSEMDRYLDKILSATVVLSVEKYRHKAVITIDSSVKNFVCEAITDDMQTAFDACLDKLKTQLRRYKERLKNHKIEKVEPTVSEPVED